MSLQTDINAAIAAVLNKYNVADTTAVSPPVQTFELSFPKVVSVVGDMTFFEDGSISFKKIDDYIAANWDGKGQPIHNYFFTDNAAAWVGADVPLTTVAVDNINYNISNTGSAATVGVFREGDVTNMLQGFSAVLKNYVLFKQFDPKSVKALPYSLASHGKISDIDAILRIWSTAADGGKPYVPTVLTRTWNVV